MILWIILAVITLAVLALLLLPLLLRKTSASQRVDYDVVVYRDQLAEVDKDIERGLLTLDQADAARSEIYRRMLAAEDAEIATSEKTLENNNSLKNKLIPAFFILVIVPLGSVLAYAFLGSPELPAKPYAARKDDSEFVMATEAERMEKVLAEKPDAEGYKKLADTYFTVHRYDQAAEAYRKAIDMSGGSAILWSELGEALTMAHDDMVVPEAHQAFVKALRLDAHEARARFYLGLSETQIGEPRRAVAIWRDLVNDSPPTAPWLAMVKEHIAAFAKDGGFDPESVPPAPPSLNSLHDMAVGMPGKQPEAVMPSVPSGDAASAIMAMDPSSQKAAIHTMVDRLAAKMKDNPDDLAGWERLANAYQVLGETDKVKEAEAKIAALKAKTPAGKESAVPAAAPLSSPPSGDAATAIMAMDPSGQDAAIRKMVDRLAAKMKDNPNDLAGWERLAKSYQVLGETDKAKDVEGKIAALKAKASGGAQ